MITAAQVLCFVYLRGANGAGKLGRKNVFTKNISFRHMQAKSLIKTSEM
jgi:hypothetical protein